jgi:hypothetical protein
MSSAYWRKSQPDGTNLSIPDLSKLYKNGLKTEPCCRPLYLVRVIHSAPPIQTTSVLHHSRLHINQTIPRGSSFSWDARRIQYIYENIIVRPTYIQKSRYSLFLHLKRCWHISRQHCQTISRTFSFSKTILNRRQYAILFCPKLQTCTYHFLN